MNSSISQSAAWLIGPDLDPSWHTISEWAIGPPADLAAPLAPAGLAHMLSGATGWGREHSIGASVRPNTIGSESDVMFYVIPSRLSRCGAVSA